MLKKSLWLYAAATAVILFFLFVTETRGFPLDDGWIHQTYARSLAENGRWEYIPGIVSAGSTAPLWTMLLAVGYLLHLPPLGWSYFLGTLALYLLLWAGMRLWRQLWPAFASRDWLAGLLLLSSWPLIWAVNSGMETVLFIAVGLSILTLVADMGQKGDSQSNTDKKRVVVLGVLSGLLILIRPDGLLLLLLVTITLIAQDGTTAARLKRLALYGAMAALPLIPYLAFNLQTSGSIWPNTFYAKQAEYALLLEQPLVGRTLQLLWLSWGGTAVGWQGMSAAHLLLLPGIFVSFWAAGRRLWQEKTAALPFVIPLLWAGGHVALYGWRLPVTYQHGRYLLAATPIWILYGLAGWLTIYAKAGEGRFTRPLKLAGGLILGLMSIIYLFLGAQAYAADTAFIEHEMVATARWVEANTPSDALIAAHDIGAMGYFGKRPLLDLAGLITPDIIPHLDDMAAIEAYISASDADYLVTAPGWPYDGVTAGKTAVYSSNYEWTVEQGANNTAVYELIRSDP